MPHLGPFEFGLLVMGGLSLLWLFALIDAIRVPEGSYRTGSTLIWVLVIVFLGWPGAVIYLLMGRPRRG